MPRAAGYLVHFRYKSRRLIKATLHMRTWGTVVLSLFGVIANSAHSEIFRNFQLGTRASVGLSVAYVAVVWFSVYLIKNDRATLFCRILFLFCPLKHSWEGNLCFYIVATTLSTVVMFKHCTPNELSGTTLHGRPALRFFHTLRAHGALLVVSVVQLYLDYYFPAIAPDLEAIDEIGRMVAEQRQAGERMSLDIREGRFWPQRQEGNAAAATAALTASTTQTWTSRTWTTSTSKWQSREAYSLEG